MRVGSLVVFGIFSYLSIFILSLFLCSLYSCYIPLFLFFHSLLLSASFVPLLLATLSLSSLFSLSTLSPSLYPLSLPSLSPLSPLSLGMPIARRNRLQKAFLFDEISVIVATIAFGMGIDKANIRRVIIWDMPNRYKKKYDNWFNNQWEAHRLDPT